MFVELMGLLLFVVEGWLLVFCIDFDCLFVGDVVWVFGFVV